MRIKTPLILAAAGALLLGACSANDATGTASSSDGPKVVASIYPLEYIAKSIVGENGTVSSLAQDNADTHDVELSPKQIASLTDADVILTLSDFQPAVDAAVKASGNKNVHAINKAIQLLPADGHAHEHGDETAHEEHAHDEHSEEAHADHDHAHDHGHVHGDFDPHFWQDPARMLTIAERFTDNVSKTFPAHADSYKANLEAFRKEMTALESEVSDGLKECKVKYFITTHKAFSYLTEGTDLEELSIVGLSSNEEPSPARIAQVQKAAKEHGVTTIFFETLTSPAVAEAIAGDLGIKTAVLDPLENVSINSPGKDYPSIMRANLEALRTANDCK